MWLLNPNAGVFFSLQQFASRDVTRSTASARNPESASTLITSLAVEIAFRADFLTG